MEYNKLLILKLELIINNNLYQNNVIDLLVYKNTETILLNKIKRLTKGCDNYYL